MPIYEYRCESCGQELEKIQRLSDPPLRDCPACGKASLIKLVSAAGFRLKGSGWYETDFKTGKKKNVLGEGKAESGGAKTEGDSKPAESKPAQAKSGESKAGDAKAGNAKPPAKPSAA